MTMSSLSSLPPEIIVKIFSYLSSINDVRRIMNTCKSFRQIYLTSNCLMKNKRFRFTGIFRQPYEIKEQMDCLKNLGEHIKSLKIDRYRFNHDFEFLKIFSYIPNIEYLEFNECYVYTNKKDKDEHSDSVWSLTDNEDEDDIADGGFSKEVLLKFIKAIGLADQSDKKPEVPIPDQETLKLKNLKRLLITKLAFEPRILITDMDVAVMRKLQMKYFQFSLRELSFDDKGKLAFGGSISWNRAFYEYLKSISGSVKKLIYKGFELDTNYMNLILKSFKNLEEFRLYKGLDLPYYTCKKFQKHRLNNVKVLILEEGDINVVRLFVKIFPNLEYMRLPFELERERLVFLKKMKHLKTVKFFSKTMQSKKQTRNKSYYETCHCKDFQKYGKTLQFNGSKTDNKTDCEFGCTADSDNEKFALNSSISSLDEDLQEEIAFLGLG